MSNQKTSSVRVLVVDDSIVVRRMLVGILAKEQGIEIVGTANDGQAALGQLPLARPDVVVLDVEMPNMNGIETLRELRKTYPRLPVIMFSSITKRGAKITLDAFSAGANDYVCKPSTLSGQQSIEQVAVELAAKIRLHHSVANRNPQQAIIPTRIVQRQVASAFPVELIAIVASTGGPNALFEVLTKLPADFPVPVVVVQHMPPVFTSALAERINRAAPLDVREGIDGAQLSRGDIWIAPGGRHMVVRREPGSLRIGLTDAPPEHGCRPAGDVLFRSAAEARGAAVLGVVLTGMGKDGAAGSRAIVDAGGQVLAQDEATSVVWGMPGCVATEGLASAVLPIDRVADELITRVSIRSARPSRAAS